MVNEAIFHLNLQNFVNSKQNFNLSHFNEPVGIDDLHVEKQTSFVTSSKSERIAFIIWIQAFNRWNQELNERTKQNE